MAYKIPETPSMGMATRASWGRDVNDNLADHELRINVLEDTDLPPVVSDITVYLAISGDDNTEDGTDPLTPYLTLQAAVDSVQGRPVYRNSNVFIQASEGTYVTGSPVIVEDFKNIHIIKDPVAVNPIIFDFFLAGFTDPNPHSLYHVPACIGTIGSTLTVDGITVRLSEDLVSDPGTYECIGGSRSNIVIGDLVCDNPFAQAITCDFSTQAAVKLGSTLSGTVKHGLKVTNGSVFGTSNNGTITLVGLDDGTGLAVDTGDGATRGSFDDSGFTIVSFTLFQDNSIPAPLADFTAKVSASDTSAAYLDDSVTVQAPLIKAISNPGASESIDFSLDLSGTATEYMNGTGAFSTPPDTDTTYENFSSTVNGLVVASGTPVGKFLKDDNTWDIPTDTDTTYSEFTDTVDGLVPAPSGDTGFMLNDGSFAEAADTEPIKTDITFYLNPAGDDDTGDGLSQVTAWYSIQKVIDHVKARPQQEVADVFIRMWGGSYTYDQPLSIINPSYDMIRIAPDTDAGNTSDIDVEFDQTTWFADMASHPDLAEFGQFMNERVSAISMLKTNILISDVNFSMSDPGFGFPLALLYAAHSSIYLSGSMDMDNAYGECMFLSDCRLYGNSNGGTVTFTGKDSGLLIRGACYSDHGYSTFILNPAEIGTGTGLRVNADSTTFHDGWTISNDWATQVEVQYASNNHPLVGVTDSDTTRSYLNDKITVDATLSKTIINPGANESIQLSVASAPSSGVSAAIDSTDSPYVIPPNVDTLYIDPSGGNISIEVPKADRYECALKVTHAISTNTITLTMEDAGNIDGASSFTGLDDINKSYIVKADGTNGWLF